MSEVTIKTGNEADFFRRGRKLAKSADKGTKIQAHRILSFEDPADVLRLLTPARLVLFKTVSQHPGSISEVASRLGRDRSAVTKDVAEMEKAGLLKVTSKILPGHGRMKEVSAAAKRFQLQAELG